MRMMTPTGSVVNFAGLPYAGEAKEQGAGENRLPGEAHTGMDGEMFTGIVEGTGRVARLLPAAEGSRLELDAVPFAAELSPGESVAVNGCCLTVVEAAGDAVKFDLLQQTLRLTNLGDLAPGDSVNLERAMQAGGRFSGHFVQGHVDDTGVILAWEPSGQDYRLDVSVSSELRRLIIPRGSITIDGISLTAAEVSTAGLTAWITPHTRAITNLVTAAPGRRVNMEIDMFAKYVDQLLRLRAEAGM